MTAFVVLIKTIQICFIIRQTDFFKEYIPTYLFELKITNSQAQFPFQLYFMLGRKVKNRLLFYNVQPVSAQYVTEKYPKICRTMQNTYCKSNYHYADALCKDGKF